MELPEIYAGLYELYGYEELSRVLTEVRSLYRPRLGDLWAIFSVIYEKSGLCDESVVNSEYFGFQLVELLVQMDFYWTFIGRLGDAK